MPLSRNYFLFKFMFGYFVDYYDTKSIFLSFCLRATAGYTQGPLAQYPGPQERIKYSSPVSYLCSPWVFIVNKWISNLIDKH